MASARIVLLRWLASSVAPPRSACRSFDLGLSSERLVQVALSKVWLPGTQPLGPATDRDHFNDATHGINRGQSDRTNPASDSRLVPWRAASPAAGLHRSYRLPSFVAFGGAGSQPKETR